MTSEEYQLDNQDKNDTALDENKESDDGSYKDDGMISDEDYVGLMFVQVVTFNMNDKTWIPDSWILLDSQLTVDVFMNKKLLHNIHDTKKPLSLHCNAGIAKVKKVVDQPGYGTVVL